MYRPISITISIIINDDNFISYNNKAKDEINVPIALCAFSFRDKAIIILITMKKIA